ncbi:MAG: SIS domain-containing protein [Pseudomonadota bacterium]
MGSLKEKTAKADSPAEYAERYLDHLAEVLKRLDCGMVQRVIDLFITARDNGNTIFFLGNGGSAATANHFANDLCVSASPAGKKRFRAVSLASNVSYLTCLANDFGYEEVFIRQLQNLMLPRDVVVGISAGGTSENVLRALDYAGKNGGISVAVVGFDGGTAKDLARYTIHVPTDKGEYGPVEDVHMVLDHLIAAYIADRG